MEELTFFVPGPLPGLNDVISWAGKRISWLEKGKKRVYKLTLEKKKWDARVEAAFLMAYNKVGGRGQPKPLKVPIHIYCLWVEPNKRRDPDNIFAGVKFVLDGLVKVGVLPNDTQQWVRKITHKLGRVDPEQPGVLVTIAPTL